MNTIKFYSTTGEFGEFSNFSHHPIKIKGKLWPSTEHYFQAMKFQTLSDQEEIRKAKSPMEAAKKGRDRRRKIKDNWDSIKVQVMKEAILAKFTQHEDLKLLLLSTAPAILIEHTENDNFWGDGGNGRGQNMLGRILMATRDQLSM